MAASPASVGGGAYSCEMAEQTRQWMEAITAFLRLHRPLLEAHVVNFFKDRLWEMVDAEWMECLRGEPVESLLKLPSGCVQEHWPSSLREFVLTARSLVLPREQKSPRSSAERWRSLTKDIALQILIYMPSVLLFKWYLKNIFRRCQD